MSAQLSDYHTPTAWRTQDISTQVGVVRVCWTEPPLELASFIRLELPSGGIAHLMSNGCIHIGGYRSRLCDLYEAAVAVPDIMAHVFGWGST